MFALGFYDFSECPFPIFRFDASEVWGRQIQVFQEGRGFFSFFILFRAITCCPVNDVSGMCCSRIRLQRLLG